MVSFEKIGKVVETNKGDNEVEGGSMNCKDWSTRDLEMFVFGVCYAHSIQNKQEGLFPGMNVNELANYLMQGGIEAIFDKFKSMEKDLS